MLSQMLLMVSKTWKSVRSPFFVNQGPGEGKESPWVTPRSKGKYRIMEDPGRQVETMKGNRFRVRW